jgi:hypothetical protein
MTDQDAKRASKIVSYALFGGFTLGAAVVRLWWLNALLGASAGFWWCVAKWNYIGSTNDITEAQRAKGWR